MCYLCLAASVCPFDGDPQKRIDHEARIEAAMRLSILDARGIELADAAALFGPMGATADAGAGAAIPPTGILTPESDPMGFGPFFDIPSGTGTNVFLGLGWRINAEISHPNDTDWFRMELVAGQTYQINLMALPFNGLGNPMLFLFDQNGTLLTSNDDRGQSFNSEIVFTATRTGTYFAGATGFGGGGQTTGSYQIALSRADFSADTVGDIPVLAAPIVVDQPLTGTIDFVGDIDMYSVTLEAGKTYAIFLEGREGSFTPLLDPYVRVRDAQLSILAENDNNGVTLNSFLAFTAEYTGVHYIEAMGAGLATGDFLLALVDFTPPPPPGPLEALDWGVQMADTHVTYYFARAGETFWNETTDSPWTEYERGQAAAAMTEFSKVSSLTFQEVGTAAQADFILTKNFLASQNSGRMAPPDPALGDIQGIGWFNTNPAFWTGPAGGLLEPGAFGYSNFIHEFGHGLGLSHPHDNGGGAAAIFDGVVGSADRGTHDLNQEVFTVMSYNKGWQSQTGPSGTLTFGIAMTPMAFDIALIQQKYGANMNHATGNDIYVLPTVNGRGTGYAAIWDAGGHDVIRHDGGAGAVIDLRPATLRLEPGGGGFVSHVTGVFGGFTIAHGVRIEEGIGGSGNDTMTAHDDGAILRGRGGNDLMRGGAGHDTLFGGAGNDNIGGGAGNDLIHGDDGADILWGGAGNDTVFGGNGPDTIYGGGTGTNRLFGDDGNDLIYAGSGGDFIGGGAGNDTIRGGAGNDTIYGGLGNDNIGGGAGNDHIFGSAGNNIIWGGFGNDTVEGGTGSDTIYGGGTGTNRLFGNDGNDLIFAGDGGDFIGGGAGNDTIRGGAGADTIYGGTGNDDIGGGAGNDVIFGSAGNNVIWGGAGNDTIHAGTGRDVMNGGPGADVFVFASAQHIGIGATRDVIADFTPGVDRIDLSALNTLFNGVAGFLGGGQASFYRFAAGGLLIGDQTGNGAADWALELAGNPAVTAADFVL